MTATDSERFATYRACGLSVRLATKKMRIVRAYIRAIECGDRRRVSKWMHANTRFDITNVNGEWSLREEKTP